jgi:hypothetical protein
MLEETAISTALPKTYEITRFYKPRELKINLYQTTPQKMHIIFPYCSHPQIITEPKQSQNQISHFYTHVSWH